VTIHPGHLPQAREQSAEDPPCRHRVSARPDQNVEHGAERYNSRIARPISGPWCGAIKLAISGGNPNETILRLVPDFVPHAAETHCDGSGGPNHAVRQNLPVKSNRWTRSKNRPIEGVYNDPHTVR
jgi:hypothetical protein